MEEVPTHVHPGPINPDTLTSQHEHRFELIWSGDHETLSWLTRYACLMGIRDRGVACYRGAADENHSNIHQHVMGITQVVSDEPSMLYPDVEGDDEDNGDADTNYNVSSASDDDNGDNDEEDDMSTPLNKLSLNIVNQWQSCQWFSNAPYDY
ncbi:hypothetical protein M9H77_21975 [Catharanthus roseus]|uniref:Uncharacterized protein n=1 Tax=Catharanthus roseus TaxID=4058 RepID=A0ACC0ANT4_CATRO|nr:hypothetical protein M9H77_21975 [Catharanthus roseus]